MEVSIDIENVNQERKRRKKRNSVEQPSILLSPHHVHGSEWKDMIHLVDITQSTARTNHRESVGSFRSRAESRISDWIAKNLTKRECCSFIPSHKYSNRCGCGVTVDEHKTSRPSNSRDDDSESGEETPSRGRWTIRNNTVERPTDSYGIIEFEGGGHHTVASYARVSFETPPAKLLKLFQNVWKLRPPKLIITIQGGISNFELQHKLGRFLRKGIMKAAMSTDAWIITSGIHQGVVRHLATAFEDLNRNRKTKSRVTSIGIAPWGLLKKRSKLVGEDNLVSYNMSTFSNGRFVELDDSHSCFLLADNGTVGRYGAEIVLRRRLEGFLASGTAPVVCVLIEGGAFSVKVVHDYVTSNPCIPVVVSDGSGRASDLLAYIHQFLQDSETIPDSVRFQLLTLVKDVFGFDEMYSMRILRQLIECAQRKKMITVYRLGEGTEDVDHAIFTALLKGHNLTPQEQLKLALAWNRPDIAKKEIFGSGTTDWSNALLQDALMDALLHDRVDFVHLLLDNGVGLQQFLTYGRLEKLYNTEIGPQHTLAILTKTKEFTLVDIGKVIDRLMGHDYRSNYTTQQFMNNYNLHQNRNILKGDRKPTQQHSPQTTTTQIMRKKSRINISTIFSKITGENIEEEEEEQEDVSESQDDEFLFENPFNELLLWAVLTRRHEMALCMWRHGDEGLAKALVACRLNWALGHEAAKDYLDIQLREQFRANMQVFLQLSTDLLEACYHVDDEVTQDLLTYELTNWGGKTNLALANIVDNMAFMAHPCCQLLLTELWHGGMQARTNSDLRVVACIFCPLLILLLEFKSKEELRRQPHTADEQKEMDESSVSGMSSDSSFSDTDSTDTDTDKRSRSSSTNVVQQLNISNLIGRKSMRKDRRESTKDSNAIRQLAANLVPHVLTGNGTAVRSRTSTIAQAKQKKNTQTFTRQRSRNSSSYAKNEEYWERDEQKEKKTPIGWKRRFIEFYTAPITVFWSWGLSFALFQIMLIYVLLLRTAYSPHIGEWFLISYVSVYGCDMIRKFVVYEARPLSMKVRKFFSSFRNAVMSVAILMFIVGFLLRSVNETRMAGRVVIIMNSALWSFKLIDYLRVHRKLGPYITTAGEMIPRTLSILTMLSVALLSFGLVRQAITYPYEEWNWLLVRNIFLKPYFMLYGEVYAPEIDTCGDDIWDRHIDEGVPISELNYTYGDTCVPGYWVAPLYMVVFMLIANVLLMNTMVACCTYVYERRVESTREIWLFERYQQVMEYERLPFLPPPLTFLYHAYLLHQYIRARNEHTKMQRLFDRSLKVFLPRERLYALHRFESECLEEMHKQREIHQQNSADEQIKNINNKNERILGQLGTISSIESILRTTLTDINQRITTLENKKKEELDLIRKLSRQLENLVGTSGNDHPTDGGDGSMPIPTVVIDGPDGTPISLSVDEDENARRRNGSISLRHHNEYTTIADMLQAPPVGNKRRREQTQVARHRHPRRTRLSDDLDNSMLLAVSEGEEQGISE